MALITLGGIELIGFEVPSSVRFGGAQGLVVHKLLGGGRIIDTMGSDNAALRWSGVLSGSDAGDRARTLDALRVAGDVLPVAWDAFAYNTIIARLDLEFHNPWWIQYDIECIVVADLAATVAAPLPRQADAVLSDLKAVSAIPGIASLLRSLSGSDALLPGSPGIMPAYLMVQTTQAAVDSQISEAEAGFGSDEVASLLGPAQALAELTSVRGYLGRAEVNLSELSN